MKTFTTHSPTEIPPVAKTGFESQYDLSERFFATVKTVDGDKSTTTVRYDHHRNRWLFGSPGLLELVEYYKEIPADRFIMWVTRNPQIWGLDVDTLSKMFDAMDEEDK